MNFKAIAAELVGTFGFVFLVVGILVVDSSPAAKLGIGLLGVSFAQGAALAAMIGATLVASGGHLNPAVSIAAWVTNRLGFMNMIGYVIAQIVGSLLALRALWLVWPRPEMSLAGALDGVPEPGMGADVFPNVFAAEAFGTALLMLVIMGSIMDKRAPRIGAIKVGLVLFALILAFGPISGGSFNPARYLGPALYGGVTALWITYVFGPILGASIAALVYQYVMGGRDDRVVVTD